MYLKFISVIFLSGYIVLYAGDGLLELQDHVKSSFKIELVNSLDKEFFGTEKERFADGALFKGIYQLIKCYGVTKQSLIKFDADNLCETYVMPRLTKGITTTENEILTGIFFDKNKRFGANSNTINGYTHLRLDVEGDALGGTHVNIQFQYGIGLKSGGTFASVNVCKGHYIDAAHLLFCLLKSADKSNDTSTVFTVNSDQNFCKKGKKKRYKE